jgi:hypothetical protein
MGSLTVDVGKESLQLFPRDIKPIDAPTAELRSVVERVLYADLSWMRQKQGAGSVPAPSGFHPRQLIISTS